MEGTNESPSLAASRSKRQRHDQKGRFAALERLRQLKGGKNKYEIKEETPVYEEIDEEAYSHLVQQRQDDDWIVDDDGSGYIEDGREIFDDDIENEEQRRKRDRKSTEKFKPPPGIKPQTSGKAKDIKSMFMSLPIKKKLERDVKLDDDDLLGDIMQEVHSQAKIMPVIPKPTILKRKEKIIPSSSLSKSAYNPFATKRISTGNVIQQLKKGQQTPSPKKCKLESRRLPKPRVVDFESLEYHSNKNLILNSENNGLKSPKKGQSSEIDEFSMIDDTPEIEEYTEDKKDETMDDFEMDIDDGFSVGEEIVKKVETEIPEKTERTSTKMISHCKDIKTEEYQLAPQVELVTTKDINVNSSQLPLVSNAVGDKVLRFFWLDAFEDYSKHPGIVYLFGKVWIEDIKHFVSCCVIVKGIERRIFLLPREKHLNLANGEEVEKDVLMKDVYEEFNDVIAEKYKINEFKTKITTKNYAFEKLDVPSESEYLEVRYSTDFPSLPGDIKGSTFSHIFGTNTSSLEQLLLNCKLKGPCWLEIKNLTTATPPISWCKVEATVTRTEDITLAEKQDAPPPFVIVSLSLQTAVNPKNQQNEIIAVSCLVHTKFHLDKTATNPPYQTHFCIFTKPSNCIFPFDFKACLSNYRNTKVELLDSERSLLGCLLAKLGKLDPDIIVGHDIYGYDLDVLIHRITVTKTPHWSRIGRLRRGGMPQQTIGRKMKQLERNVVCGRLLCDIKISSKELIKSKSYDLTELVKQVLHKNRIELPQEEVINMYRSSEQLIHMINCTMADSDYTLRLMCEMNVLPLALQITNIAGNLMSRTLLGGRSERNEFLLLHAFNEKNFICPDKNYSKKNVKVSNIDEEEIEGKQTKSSRRKPAYTGGLVLEPKKGFYDKYILLMDFNSLYPSIIQEYNICFTTIERLPEDTDCENIKLPERNLEPGILPTEIRKLVESRRQVKQLMKSSELSPEQYLQYDIRQKALKLTANSMYGCLGFTNSRFYAKPLAALITGKGREILMQTKDLVEKMGLEVIYGDTDSLMINSNNLDYEQVIKTGNKIKAEVNRLYRHLEIDIDGVFKSILLLKKKKYAALNVTLLPNGELFITKELKGLDIVRRDWSELAKKAGNKVVEEILSGKRCEEIVESIHSHLIQLAEDLKKGQLPLSEFIITKQLTKNPENYPDKKNLPHVQVALRINSRGGRHLRQGDTVEYIICEDGSNLSAIQRSYHPDEIKNNDNLKIDNHYYLAHQIHPVVSRLCNPIEGTDAATIADFLGLDPSGYRQVAQTNDDEDNALLGTHNDTSEDCFKNCDKLVLLCPNENCEKEFTVEADLVLKALKREYDLPVCPNLCGMSLVKYTASFCNQLNKIMRQYIQKYYQKWLVCEDPGCDYRTRKLPLCFTRNGPLCPACEKSSLYCEYTDSQLYQQLLYFQTLFDIDQAKSSLTPKEREYSNHINQECENFYYSLKNEAEKMLKKNAYDVVDLNKLFADLYPSPTP